MTKDHYKLSQLTTSPKKKRKMTRSEITRSEKICTSTLSSWPLWEVWLTEDLQWKCCNCSNYKGSHVTFGIGNKGYLKEKRPFYKSNKVLRLLKQRRLGYKQQLSTGSGQQEPLPGCSHYSRINRECQVWPLTDQPGHTCILLLKIAEWDTATGVGQEGSTDTEERTA